MSPSGSHKPGRHDMVGLSSAQPLQMGSKPQKPPTEFVEPMRLFRLNTAQQLWKACLWRVMPENASTAAGR